MCLHCYRTQSKSSQSNVVNQNQGKSTVFLLGCADSDKPPSAQAHRSVWPGCDIRGANWPPAPIRLGE